MNECCNGETEHRNSNAEHIAIDVDHFVMALHGAQRRFDHGTAGILILFARVDVGLFTNHTFTLN
ncbi:hypothetical protein dsmv_3848, partial [Desulfococcus multivorans DSM 2059]